jgi:CO dehydrogenase maturation factor
VKLGVVGKGGVGKTTVAALVAQAYAARGRRVVAIDTDSNPNLGLSLGLSLDRVDAAPELPRRLVVGRGGDADAATLLDEYGLETPAGIRLVTAMRVGEAGAGCTCGGHATVRSLLGEALEEQADVTVVDMEAGLEHLSRSGGTLAAADALLVVMEPSRKSVVTAARTRLLAEELGLEQVHGVGNKVRSADDGEFLAAACAEHGVPLAGLVPYAEHVAAADRDGAPVSGAPAEVREAVERVLDVVEACLV